MDEQFMPLWEGNSSMQLKTRPCIVCDVDGTIADATHRLHFIQNKPKNWPAFFDACIDDSPIEHMRTILCAITKGTNGELPIVYCSGRPERCREMTQAWKEKHGFPNGNLYMRADGDHRDDSIVKAELLERMRSWGWAPIMAFDDRARVVDMWRANGIPCAQVAPGDF